MKSRVQARLEAAELQSGGRRQSWWPLGRLRTQSEVTVGGDLSQRLPSPLTPEWQGGRSESHILMDTGQFIAIKTMS